MTSHQGYALNTPSTSNPFLDSVGGNTPVQGNMSTTATGSTSFSSQQPPQQDMGTYIWKNSSQPIALLFHLAFRTAAVICYILTVIGAPIFLFVIIILLLSFDFWTVKNVTGRLLVGLRWWNEVSEDGTSQWVYESRNGNGSTAAVAAANPFDSKIFWGSLYTYFIIWIAFSVLAIFRFTSGIHWILLTFVAISMNAANLFGYIKCDQEAKRRANSASGPDLSGGMMQSLMGNMISSRITGMFGTGKG